MGDGTFLFGLAVQHAYDEPGDYTVTLDHHRRGLVREKRDLQGCGGYTVGGSAYTHGREPRPNSGSDRDVLVDEQPHARHDHHPEF